MLKFWYGLYRWSAKSDYTIIYVLGGLALVMGCSTYYVIYDLPFFESFIYATQLLAMEVKTPFELKEFLVELNATTALCNLDGILNSSKDYAKYWWIIYIAAALATMTLIVGIVSILIKHKSSMYYVQRLIDNGEHTIVVGLGRNSRFFVNSMLKDEEHKMVVFEKKSDNHYIEQYRDKPMAMVEADVENSLKDLNISNAKHIFISTGNDETNIYLAIKFMAEVNEKKHSIEKLVVHIEDRTLRNLYDNDKALHKENIDLRHFSFYKEAARILFKEHAVEGDDCKILNSAKIFHMIIVGNSEFSIALIAEACRLSNLPNENELHIHCMGLEKEAFEQRLFYAFPEIGNISHVKLDYIEVDSTMIDFYKHEVWKNENLTHVIYADDSALENIGIATKVSGVTYLRTNEHIKNTKFHIATMNHIKVAQEIQGELKEEHVFTCAEADKICSRENLFSNRTDFIGKMIHYTYMSPHFRKYDFKVHDGIVNRTWREASINDKRTSIAQAIHINTKLKVLGLKRKKVVEKITILKLHRQNVNMLNSRLKKDMAYLGLTKIKLREMEKGYQQTKNNGFTDAYFFPKKYNTTLEKMLRMEHNRWMTVLRLMDNIYEKEAVHMKDAERKRLKVHHLLKPFSEFETNEEKIYVLNDFHAIKNIARYMTLTGHEIIEF